MLPSKKRPLSNSTADIPTSVSPKRDALSLTGSPSTTPSAAQQGPMTMVGLSPPPPRRRSLTLDVDMLEATTSSVTLSTSLSGPAKPMPSPQLSPTTPSPPALLLPKDQESLSPLSLSSSSHTPYPWPSTTDSLVKAFQAAPHSVQMNLLKSLVDVASGEALQQLVSLAKPRLRTDFVGILPVEIAIQILVYVPVKHLLEHCLRVSRRWAAVLSGREGERCVWKKKLYLEKWADEQEIQKLITPPYTLLRPPPKMYLNLVRKHHETVQNWYMNKYKRISFPGHGSHVVTCLQFDDDKIVSGSDDHSIHVYDTNTGTLRRMFKGHDGGVWALEYWKHILVSGSTDRVIRVWSLNTGRSDFVFEGHISTVRCLLIHPPSVKHNPAFVTPAPLLSKPLIITGSRDHTLRVWLCPDPDVDAPFSGPAESNPYFVHTLTGHTLSVRAIAAAGNTLVSGSYDTTVRIWDIEKGVCRFVCTGHRDKVYSVGIALDIERAVSGSLDNTVRIWCTATGSALHLLEGHTSLVGLLEITPKYLVSAAADSNIRIWNPMTGECLGCLTGHAAAITCFEHDPDLNRIVAGADGCIKAWEVSSLGFGTSSIPPEAHARKMISHVQSPSGMLPNYGRFIGNLLETEAGVWRIRMNRSKLVAALQRSDSRTWFEVLDYSAGNDGSHVTTVGDGYEDDEFEDEEDDSSDEMPAAQMHREQELAQ